MQPLHLPTESAGHRDVPKFVSVAGNDDRTDRDERERRTRAQQCADVLEVTR